MSQPCSMVELVLFDARSLEDARVVAALHETARRGIHRGAISEANDVAAVLEESGLTDAVDLWLPGADGAWPFDRALALTGVEPGRVLFVSTRDTANTAAQTAGLQTCEGDLDQIDRRLP